jgi:hypothetical protein
MISVGHCSYVLEVPRSYNLRASVISLCIKLFFVHAHDFFDFLHIILWHLGPTIALHHKTNSWHLLTLNLYSRICGNVVFKFEALNGFIHFIIYLI